MASLISLILIITCSILVTKVATTALVHTGLSKQTAKFQARSAFTGVGFTTRESERLVRHPVRRKIIMLLMLLGNVGIISALASLILTFVNVQLGAIQWLIRLGILAVGLAALWAIASSRFVNKWLSRIINSLLDRYTNLRVRDYEGILHLKGEYEISEMIVEKRNWMVNRKLKDLKIRDEGINLIGIERENGTYIGSPKGETEIHEGDTLVLYSRASAIEKLNKRSRNVFGKLDHEEAVLEQREISEKEAVEEEKHDLLRGDSENGTNARREILADAKNGE